MPRPPTRSQHLCPVCRLPLEPFIELNQIPIDCDTLWEDQQSARSCPRGDIRLGFCEHCGFVSNMAFDETHLQHTASAISWDIQLPLNQQYTDELAKALVERYGLKEKHIIEIGSKGGRFLRTICSLGNNWGIGFDPEHTPTEEDTDGRISFIQDFFSKRYAPSKCDFLCCRLILQRIDRPRLFLESIRDGIDEASIPIYFEVPNMEHILSERNIWDITYKHCGYFTQPSVAHAFRLSGFRLSNIQPVFNNRYLAVEATPGGVDATTPDSERSEISRLSMITSGFREICQSKLASWEQTLRANSSEQSNTVVWGCDSRGVAFLNMISHSGSRQFALDLDPNKHGRFIPGSAQRVLSPNDLVAINPQIIILNHEQARKEASSILAELNLKAKILSL